MAQPKNAGTVPPNSLVTVPFVGCESDGQTGPLEVPVGKPRRVPITTQAASQLAWYKAESGFGVLAPRGWHCFYVYGSGGDAIYVSPTSITSRQVFSSTWPGITGPVVIFRRSYGDTSGRQNVAEIVARVFPIHKAFVDRVREMFDQPAEDFPAGAFLQDKVHYKSNELVEYETPANTDGLGTRFPLKPGPLPVAGVAILIAADQNDPETFDAALLSVRLPQGLRRLAASIVGQAERDAATDK